MIDYDNSIFKEVWDYELERDLENRSVLSISLSTGKFYDSDKNVIYYMKGGKYHREDGPAYIRKKGIYFNSHFVWYNYGENVWYNYGEKHRVDGPAIRVFGQKNNKKQFWIFGRLMFESDFLIFSNLGNGNEVILL
ncbi:MAG: hypothetical protein ACOCV1_03160 [Bacillota bacterium]